MKSRKSKNNKKKITLALAAGVALTSFSTLSAKADEQVDLKSTGNTVAEEKHVQASPTTSITQVEGVKVSNGTALVTKTPTKAIVEEAKEIKGHADQAVEAQTPVVEDAKKQEATTSGTENSAKQALEQAKQKKDAATPQAIEETKTAMDTSKKEVTTQTEKIDSLKDQQNQVQKKKEAQETVVKEATDATNKQAEKVAGAKKKVQNVQDVLNGTGADKIVKEEKDAKKDLEAKKAIVKDAKKVLEQSQNADATKVRKLNAAKELEVGQKNAFDQATSVLSSATQAHNEATSQRDVAKQNKDNAQAILDGTGTTAIFSERDNAKSDLATKETTLTDATKKLTDAKSADAKKAEQLNLLDEAKTQAEDEEANASKAKMKAQGGANRAATKLEAATQDEKDAKNSLASSESRLPGVTEERDNAKSDLATKESAKDEAERKLDEAKNTDAQKRSDIQDLKDLKEQQEASKRMTAQELLDATTAAKNAENAKNEADKAVDTLEKQISAIKNLTIPQLSQNVIAAYKTYLNDDSEANKHALNNAIQAWYKGGKYDFGTRQFEWSDNLQTTVFKGWSNKNIVLPIDNTIVNLDNPTDEQIKALSHYYALLANNLQDQVWGTHSFIVTKESVQGIKNIAKNYANENKPYNSGHSDPALNNLGVDGVRFHGEVMNYINTLSSTSPLEKAIDTEKTHKATMSQLYREVYDAVIAFMTNDIHADFGHMKGMVGDEKPTLPSAVGGNISYTANNVGRMHFVQFAGKDARYIISRDPKTGERTERYVDEYYQNGIAKPLPTPFDTSKMEKDLEQAKKTQVSAISASNNAQNRLTDAQRADETAEDNLTSTTNRLNALLNTQDLTPNAERAFNTATAELSQAQLRNTNASTAYANLTEEIETKRTAHEKAEDVLSKATVANTVAQKTLQEATAAHNNVLEKLSSIKDAIKRTQAIKDLTPDAQAKFNQVTVEYKAAQTRLENAETAVLNLNASLQEKRQALAVAVKALEDAESLVKTTQAKLEAAQATYKTADDELVTTRKVIAKLEATKDLTPDAQQSYDQALEAEKLAEKRLSDAKVAVENLTADVKTKQEVLNNAQAELAQEEKALEGLKAKQAQEEEVLATIQAQLVDLKTQEKAVRTEIAKIETHIKELETLLDSLVHASENYEVAKEEYEKALEAHRLVLQALETEQTKLNVLLQNQLDAKAQYEAVLLAYQKAYNKSQESLNHRHDSKVENLEHKLGTDKLRSALSNPAYIYVGNKPKYGVNTTLPNTGSESSLFLIGLGAMLMGLSGIKSRRKSE
ncbi:MAG: SEC10/PgrA surface exclusion domain-containing protein [Staphylococcus epidermidis]|nr:SEC10/PgrA surface exclusion domain-containing protein [Staphylococcus epidermidis]